MNAEIVCIGTELLLGDIVNTNAQYLAKRLSELGINVYYQTVVGDNPGRIRDAVQTAFSRADLVITTGGLGPTKDDISKEVVMETLGFEPVLDKVTERLVRLWLRFAGVKEVAPEQLKQAYVPKGGVILRNKFGTAPGCAMESGGKLGILLPGPPREMKPMFETAVKKVLSQYANQTLVSVNIYTKDFLHAPVGIVGEWPVAEKISDLFDLTDPTVATYAGKANCRIRVTSRGADREEAHRKIDPVVEDIVNRIGKEYIDHISDH